MEQVVNLITTYWYILLWLYLGLSLLVYTLLEGRPPQTLKDLTASLIAGLIVICFVVVGGLLSVIGTIITFFICLVLCFLSVPVWIVHLIISKIR